jgi:uncharacterized repeat protein (TIGR01451 family)
MPSRTIPVLAVVFLALLRVPASAQRPYVPPGPVLPPFAAPLLYVRLTGPAGMAVTLYRGGAQAETLTAPVTVGLRPGYVYRLKVNGLANPPAMAFYPTLEVRGSLQADPHLNPADFPIPLDLTTDDFRAAERGALVSKAVVLERPSLALPLATRPQQPLRLRVPANRDPLAEAEKHGRVLLILRMGEREWSEAELTAQAIPNTILLPGEKELGAPPLPPWRPWQCLPLLYDPLLGPAPGSEETCVPDGGDSGTAAGYDEEGRLRGLDPSDTIAEYQDSHGRRRIAISNRVCLCIPRFLVFFGEVRPAVELALRGPNETQTTQAGNVLHQQRTPVAQQQEEHLVQTRTRKQPSAAEVLTGPVIYGQIAGLKVTGVVRGPGMVNAACPGPEEQAPPDRPLIIIKWPDKCAALVGDVVTFYLRYTNQGGRPVTNVVLSDSLASRYEFLPGSARSDRAATFTTQANEVGSVILRWQLTEPLPPGESGTVSFQVRVR